MVSASEKIRKLLKENNLTILPEIKDYWDIERKVKWGFRVRLFEFSFARKKIEFNFFRDYLDDDFYYFEIGSNILRNEIIAVTSKEIEQFSKNVMDVYGLNAFIKFLLKNLTFVDFTILFPRPIYDIIDFKEKVINDSADKINPNITVRKENAEKERNRRFTKEWDEDYKDYYKEYEFRYKDIDYEKIWEGLMEATESERQKKRDIYYKSVITIKAKTREEAKEIAKKKFGKRDFYLHNARALTDEPINPKNKSKIIPMMKINMNKNKRYEISSLLKKSIKSLSVLSIREQEKIMRALILEYLYENRGVEILDEDLFVFIESPTHYETTLVPFDEIISKMIKERLIIRITKDSLKITEKGIETFESEREQIKETIKEALGMMIKLKSSKYRKKTYLILSNKEK